MLQLDLSYTPSHAGREGWLLALEALRSAVAYLGQKEVCYALDVAKSTLSEALNERNDKRIAGEWICKVAAMLAAKGDDEARRLGRAMYVAMVALMPCFTLADADDVPTAAEIAMAEKVLAKVKRRAV
jgi:hypothetical protein